MPIWGRARTIVEEQSVSADIENFRQAFARFDEAYDALKWNLARRADSLGLHSHWKGTEYRLYRQDRDPIALTPSLIVVYTYSVDAVTIVALRAEQ
jgi:hypothetical protein